MSAPMQVAATSSHGDAAPARASELAPSSVPSWGRSDGGRWWFHPKSLTTLLRVGSAGGAEELEL